MTDNSLEVYPYKSNNEQFITGLPSGELQQSQAVSQLKTLLKIHEQEYEDSPPMQRRTSTSRPLKTGEEKSVAINDLVPIIQDQSQYIQHLEAEVKFCKEELSSMKHRVQLVVLENEELHVHISRMAQTGLREQTVLDSSTDSMTANRKHQNDIAYQSPLSSTNVLEEQKWQKELERLQCLHQAKIETLESQIKYLRKDLADSQKNCEELQNKLKKQETSFTGSQNSVDEGGLCVKCANVSVYKISIERLTRERDELVDALLSLKKSQILWQQRELKPYNQVKHAVEMTEEANLKKTKALVNCEQLRREIERKNAQFEKEVNIQFEKMSAEKQEIREEAKKEREQLLTMITSLSENASTLESQLKRVTREKNELVRELEEIQQKLAFQEEKTAKVCAEMCFQLNQIKMKKEEAEKEHKEYRIKNLKDLDIKNKEIEKHELQLNKNKQWLEQAQLDATRAKDECLRLTELLGNAEHQLHLTRLEKDDIQQRLSSEVRSLAFQTQKCEQELKQKMQQMEAQHDQMVNEMVLLMASQNTLISRLKKECNVLAKQLEHVTERNRSDVQVICHENVHAHNRIEELLKREDELEAQCIQHGKMHERMKARLQELDKHCMNSALRIVNLLDKYNELMEERQLLIEEVQALKKQKIQMAH
ncbi:hypothetical protein XENTR_v10013866 [Xenopus tropicalis]|uniref:Serologically defined colon cancer antigen 8 n=1 Tax=Xenopus tropicalis TaxID=8364 RepID=F6XA00_XENTR|nr:serologically defined colon cancer antigen 8 isoform X1 [Xenopus tropicalis]XP_012819175.2 serologically defined colon cancer antigen 8 isoform X1 [Xenopus tropicalis]KAE8602047.1 hypothetical protein XENTR_v10013866 [Xenopus tropicalis]KAE8602048.1 hypothetical protein XENTR_v10013866 [Xenopus tropicalis]KAE8602049.1 hypothetical protein XENTR_v10013866 [Xenopus tropicalis]KAE8602050.1 hypothetical protein XENTR_v10013866 [Xenopus tropicalis]